MATNFVDKPTGMILDFIAGGVPTNKGGESGGNYNAVIGNAKATDDLGKMSIDDIIHKLMPRLLAAGRPSTAIGRYQIIRATMRTLVDRLHIAPVTLFTPEIQDKMALALLNGRGFQKWRGEFMSSIDFAHNLSCEWASLPDPYNNGKSHYDGIGPNHAGTTLYNVYQMLISVKKGS